MPARDERIARRVTSLMCDRCHALWSFLGNDAHCRALGLLPPPLAGEGRGGGAQARILLCAPSLSLPRKRGRGRCGTSHRVCASAHFGCDPTVTAYGSPAFARPSAMRVKSRGSL